MSPLPLCQGRCRLARSPTVPMPPAGAGRRAGAPAPRQTRSRLWLYLVAGLAASGLVAPLAEGRVHVQLLSRENGLPSMQVHAAQQGPDGFLWFAGPGGLTRYDGWKLTSYQAKDGLTTAGLRSLSLDATGRLWVGTDVGVDLRESDGRIHPLVAPSSWPGGFVEGMALGPGGEMWIASSKGLLRWSEALQLEQVEEVELRDRLVAAVVVDSAGTVWATAPRVGLLRRKGEQWQHIELPELKALGRIQCLAATSRGSVLVGGEAGLVELTLTDEGTQGRTLLPDGSVTAALEVGDELWVGVSRQLQRLNRSPAGWSVGETVLDNVLVNQLFADTLGNLWAATDNLGVAKISALRNIVHGLDAPCTTQVFSVQLTADDSLLVGGDTCSWVQGRGGGGHLQRLSSLDGIKVWDLLEDGHGALWAATEEGLFMGDRDGLRRIDRPSETLNTPGRVLLAEGERLWFGTVTGLVKLEGGTVTPALDVQGHPLGYVYTLERDAEGHLWVGTIGNGAWRQVEGGAFDRLSFEVLRPQSNIYSIAFGKGGRVALAQDDKVIVLESGTAREFNSILGDPVAAWDLLFDEVEPTHLWAGGLSGLVRYDLPSGEPTLRLTASMGLGGEEFTTSRSLSHGRAGELLCGLNTGLVSVDVRAALEQRPFPEAILVELRWSDATVNLTASGLQVEQGPWILEANAAAPWFLDETSLTYRHRLVGFSADWSPPEPRSAHQIRYTALPPGDYGLELQAASPLVGWGAVKQLLSFRVRAVWWRRGWAMTLWGTLLVAAFLGLVGWRGRGLARRSRKLEELVEERTQALTKALEEVEVLAAQDALTGLPNRRSLRAAALQQRSYALRHNVPFGFLLLDLDHFKQVNDTYGHSVGDEVLLAVAQRLVEISRDSDVVARYGGEEFIILAPNCSEEQLLQTAERVRHEISLRPFEVNDQIRLTVTVSVGVSSWHGEEESVDSLFQRADRALYAAKATRNTVTAWHSRLDSDAPAQ